MYQPTEVHEVTVMNLAYDHDKVDAAIALPARSVAPRWRHTHDAFGRTPARGCAAFNAPRTKTIPDRNKDESCAG